MRAVHEEIAPIQKKRIVDLLSLNRWPLYFYGPVGTGKTCAAVAVYTNWIKPVIAQEGIEIPNPWTDPLFFSCAVLTGQLAEERDQRQKIFRKISHADLVVLDDVGRRKLTDEQAEILIQITEIRSRKPTIWTSNQAPQDLADSLGDQRIASRILEGNYVEFSGNDRRI